MGRAEIEILRSALEAADRGDWDATFLHAHSYLRLLVTRAQQRPQSVNAYSA
jgi:hypothetical protein